MLLLHHVNFLEAQPRTGFCSNNALILYRIIVFHTIAYSILRSKKGIDKITLSVPFAIEKRTVMVTVHVAAILRSVAAVNEVNSNLYASALSASCNALAS